MTVTASPLPQRAAYTIREARRLLGGIAQPSIYKLINSGQLRSFKVGRRRFVSAEALTDYIRSAENEAGAAA